jgi:hypothetical protein
LEERVDWREAYYSVQELDERVAQLHEYRSTKELWFEESEGGHVQPPPFYDTGRCSYCIPEFDYKDCGLTFCEKHWIQKVDDWH